MMIQAQYKDGDLLDFTDVSEMLRWSAGKLGCEVMELTTEVGGAHCDAVQVWIYFGEFDADEAISAGLSPNVARAWQVLV